MFPIVRANVKTDRTTMVRVRRIPQQVVLPDRSSRCTRTEKGSSAVNKEASWEVNRVRHFLNFREKWPSHLSYSYNSITSGKHGAFTSRIA